MLAGMGSVSMILLPVFLFCYILHTYMSAKGVDHNSINALKVVAKCQVNRNVSYFLCVFHIAKKTLCCKVSLEFFSNNQFNMLSKQPSVASK